MRPLWWPNRTFLRTKPRRSTSTPSHQLDARRCRAATLDLSSLFKSCASPTHLKQLHARAVVHGLQNDTRILATTTLRYLSLGLLDSAELLFRSLPHPSSYVWNMMIRSFATIAHFDDALRLYSAMLGSGVPPDKFAFPFAIKSCAGLSDLRTGRAVHQQSLRFGCSGDVYVDAALVDMYAKCGQVENARRVFDGMPERDLVSWQSMISGYAHNGHSTKTLGFFRLMQDSGVWPSRVALLSALLASAQLGGLRKGELFHNYAVRTGFESHILVATAIIDMYAKCGNLDAAKLVFDCTATKDVVCWSAMIACYGFYGCGRKAVGVFDQMINAGVQPNHVTFTSILAACSHSGLLEEGRAYFGSMSDSYGLLPKLNHYACMVDLLGRAGKLSEAKDLIEKMPMAPDSSLWGTLLGACRIHGNYDMIDYIADRMLELEPSQSGYYVLLSNIYAAKSRWKDVERVRELMSTRKVSKDQGVSLIELNDHIHKFGVEERSHPQSQEIYDYLEELAVPIKQLGYVPMTDLALHDIEEEGKEAALSLHSERIAITFGLLKTRPGYPIRVTKNLRICGDCHSWTKIVSKVSNRVIIVRDAKRFHCFENGVCSCGDYW